MIKPQIRVDHVISFADAIFAFSITFMAISIHIPEIAQNLNQAQVFDKLLESIPEFEIYVISFFVIGVYWIAYHQIFNHIACSHSTITWLTIVFLFFITLIPLATNLQIGFGQYQIIFALYSLVLTIAGSLLTIIWLHATKNKLIDENLNRNEIHFILLESILSPVVFLLSILVSFIDLRFAYYFWIVIIPAKMIVRKKYYS
ncbi:MAG TPA: TMEM175 family protein [Candidatus Nitrosopolaris sp.]|nr:TMEM175 family protein [Candidatus Nitrosopolaris sp.]